jgi:putative PIN family toxin of toxin-antitoxin system
MIRVVLDTNVVVSAYLNEDGFPRLILILGLAKAVRLYLSPPVLAEYEELLLRKSYPMDRRRAKLLLSHIQAVGIMVHPAAGEPLTSDPDDTMFLECAQVAKAHYLVTGNTNHFPQSWKYTRIVTPRQFVYQWAEHLR